MKSVSKKREAGYKKAKTCKKAVAKKINNIIPGIKLGFGS